MSIQPRDNKVSPTTRARARSRVPPTTKPSTANMPEIRLFEGTTIQNARNAVIIIFIGRQEQLTEALLAQIVARERAAQQNKEASKVQSSGEAEDPVQQA
ncbi:unnamed protein product [Cyclocybe aegerita]|uniref:Uncharacterized protein n=1 Tax=Cyclocybe aegerita TaxID=1973307 RepID=A0A8S0XF05_CYCAE|nr:unnamed protein product [Cyclocybe aegerita]